MASLRHPASAPLFHRKNSHQRKSTPRLDAETPLAAYRAVRGCFPLYCTLSCPPSSFNGDVDPFSVSMPSSRKRRSWNGERARGPDEEKEATGTGGTGRKGFTRERKNRERGGKFRGLAAQMEPESEKNWRGMMAPSPSTREIRWQGVEEFRGCEKGGGAHKRVPLGGIHPGCSSFLQYVCARAVHTIDEVLEKPSWDYAHVPRTRWTRARGRCFCAKFSTNKAS